MEKPGEPPAGGQGSGFEEKRLCAMAASQARLPLPPGRPPACRPAPGVGAVRALRRGTGGAAREEPPKEGALRHCERAGGCRQGLRAILISLELQLAQSGWKVP